MEGQKNKFNFNEYLQIFRRRRAFFLIPLIVVSFSFLISGYFLPRIYEAKAIILIEEKKVVNPLLQNLAVSSTVAERLQALREEILAWPRLYQLVERLGLTKEAKSPIELERLITRIRKSIMLGMKSEDIVIISYQGKERRGTQQLVNTLCDILIERNLSITNEDTQSAITFIEDQLGIYKEKLNGSDAALREFKEVYGLEVLPQLQESDSASKKEDSSGFTAPLIQISAELASLESDLVMASVDCTDEHPRIKNLKKQIETLKEKRNEYIADAATRTGINSEKYVQIAGSLPRQQEELSRLSRDKAINEKIYEMLLQRLESAKITESLDNSENRTKFRVVEPARLPLFPVKPNKLKLNLLGLVLGGMIGFGFTYVVELTDSSYKTTDELKNAFDIPVLGSISKIVTEEDLDKRGLSSKRLITVVVIVVILITVISIIMARAGIGFVMLVG